MSKEQIDDITRKRIEKLLDEHDDLMQDSDCLDDLGNLIACLTGAITKAPPLAE